MTVKPVYLANENGDWWEFHPDSVLYVLRASDIPDSETEELDIRDGIIYNAPDKFEDTIMEFGTRLEEFFADVVAVLDGDPTDYHGA